MLLCGWGNLSDLLILLYSLLLPLRNLEDLILADLFEGLFGFLQLALTLIDLGFWSPEVVLSEQAAEVELLIWLEHHHGTLALDQTLKPLDLSADVQVQLEGIFTLSELRVGAVD